MNHLLADDHLELDILLKEFFEAFETGDPEKTYQTLDFFWARLAIHIRVEHLHLFPAVLDAAENRTEQSDNLPTAEKVKNAIGNLQDDHNFFMREILAAVKNLRELRGDNTAADFSARISDVREKIILVKDRLETHNRIEETKVYLWADHFLETEERELLCEKMQKEITNLPPRFSTNFV